MQSLKRKLVINYISLLSNFCNCEIMEITEINDYNNNELTIHGRHNKNQVSGLIIFSLMISFSQLARYLISAFFFPWEHRQLTVMSGGITCWGLVWTLASDTELGTGCW